MENNKQAVINHISRLEGQLASVKAILMEDEPDCIKASKTLLSASRSFAGLREKFVDAFLQRYFVAVKGEKEAAMFSELLTLIKG